MSEYVKKTSAACAICKCRFSKNGVNARSTALGLLRAPREQGGQNTLHSICKGCAIVVPWINGITIAAITPPGGMAHERQIIKRCDE